MNEWMNTYMNTCTPFDTYRWTYLGAYCTLNLLWSESKPETISSIRAVVYVVVNGVRSD